MCGINLIVTKKENVHPEHIIQMNKALHHRGPDANGWKEVPYNEKKIFFGNTRLKVLDLSDTANQPLVYQDRYYLTYNGEIYNHSALRSKLGQEFEFTSNSDSEVLLFHLIKYGIKGIKDLNGMFGFAFYDSLRDQLLLARDRFGVKPVYYYQDESTLIASSELKGIFASQLVKKSLRPQAIEEYLTYKFSLKPDTFFQQVYELEEGKVLIYENGKSNILNYYRKDLANKTVLYSRQELVSKTEVLLKDSLYRQLRSDVPTGLFLSGGIDSTLLLTLATELGYQLPCFSICNSKEEQNYGTEDYLYAEKAAHKYNADFNRVQIDESILDAYPEFITSIDQPVADGAAFLTWILSKHASEKVKVILTGAGADELFAGYNRHFGYYQYLKFLYKTPLLATVKAATEIWPSNIGALRKTSRLFKKFSGMEHDPALTYLKFSGLNTGLFETNYDTSKVFPVKADETTESLFRAGLQFDTSRYLISDILAITDSMTMQSSIEARVPFLDNELYTFLTSIPATHLIRHGQKWILKDILREKGASEFTTRKKEGFGMPLSKWWRTKQGKNIIEGLTDKNNLIYTGLSFKKLSNLLESHSSKKSDLSSELWALTVLSAWLEKEFN